MLRLCSRLWKITASNLERSSLNSELSRPTYWRIDERPEVPSSRQGRRSSTTHQPRPQRRIVRSPPSREARLPTPNQGVQRSSSLHQRQDLRDAVTAAWNPFTTEDLEEMERCFNRIQLTILMAS